MKYSGKMCLHCLCEILCHLFGIGFTGELFFERSMIFSPLPSRYHKTDTTISTSVFMYTWLFRNSKFNFDTTSLNNFSLAVKRKKVEADKIPKHTGKNLCLIEFSTKIHWNTNFAASDVLTLITLAFLRVVFPGGELMCPPHPHPPPFTLHISWRTYLILI